MRGAGEPVLRLGQTLVEAAHAAPDLETWQGTMFGIIAQVGFEVAFLKDTQKNSGLPEGVTTRHTLSFCARAGTPIFHPKTLRSHHE